MKHVMRMWLVVMIAIAANGGPQEADPPDNLGSDLGPNLCPSFAASEELQAWLATIDESHESRAAIDVLIGDAKATVAQPTANIRNNRNIDPKVFMRAAVDAINAIRASDRKLVDDVAALVDAPRAAHARFVFEVFEYERMRQYCLYINLQKRLLPDITSALRDASVDLASLAAQPRARSQDDVIELVRAFWAAHAQELIAGGVSYEASSKVVENLSRAAINLLGEWAQVANIDLEAFHAKRMCEAYPALCMRTPTDLAFDTARPLVPEESAAELKTIYEQYLQRRSALRAILAQAQTRWDEPAAAKRRNAEYYRLLAERKDPTGAWRASRRPSD